MARIEYIGAGQFVYKRQNIGPDYNFPGVAQDLGWSLRRVQLRRGKVVVLKRRGKGCEHRSTDGSVKCAECGLDAMAFINAAREYLEERAGA